MGRDRFSPKIQALIVIVILTASACFWAAGLFLPWTQWPQLLMFFFLITIATTFPIPDPRGGFITAAPVLYYVLIAIHGPAAGVVVACCAYAVGAAISRGWLTWRTIFNGSQMGISVGLAGLAYVLAGGMPGVLDFRSGLLPLVLAVLIHQAANNFFVSFYFSKVRNIPFLSTWIGDMKGLIVSNILSVPITVLLAYLYVTVHPLTLLFYLVSLPFQRRAHELQLRQKLVFDQAIDALVVAVDAGFPQGMGHSRRVANTAMIVARNLGLSEEQLDTIELGALLHDVGMIGLDEVLNSSDVSDDVLEALKEHVSIGAEVSRELPQRGIADIVLYHHERFDGSGYPKGLRGSQIPIGARVVALAEEYESMRAGGFPYGNPRTIAEAREAVIAQAGRSFDPLVVSAFADAILDQESVPVGPIDGTLQPGAAS